MRTVQRPFWCARPADLTTIEICTSGLGLHFPKLDADLYLLTFGAVPVTALEPHAELGAEAARFPADIKAVMNSSNAWAEFAGVFCRTRSAFLEHENAKVELKGLMPEDVKEAIGHGIRAKRSKAGAVSFDVLSQEETHAPVQ